MRVNDIKFGDIVTYRSGRVNNVNNPYRYHEFLMIILKMYQKEWILIL